MKVLFFLRAHGPQVRVYGVHSKRRLIGAEGIHTDAPALSSQWKHPRESSDDV